MKNCIFILVVISLFDGCASVPKPGSSLDDVQFFIFPHIVKRDGKYFLQYQVSVTDDRPPALVRVVYKDIVGSKAYYYFSIPVSHFEEGQLVERSLETDGLTEFAKQDAIYWLNRNHTEVKLKIE